MPQCCAHISAQHAPRLLTSRTMAFPSQLWAVRVHDRRDAGVPVDDPTASTRTITLGGHRQTTVLPWPRLRAVSVEPVDARAEAAAELRALAARQDS